MLIGWEGWLFYQPDLRSITGYGPMKPEPFSVMKDPELALQPAAGDCIRAFARELKERGIQLVFVPVPLKTMIYPEMIAPNTKHAFITHPDAAAFYDSLRRDGVDVIDLTADFAKLRTTSKHLHYLEANSDNRAIARQSEEALKLKTDAFLKQDTHWTTDAMRLTAEKVADHVKEKYPRALRPMARTITAVDGAPRESLGDLVKLLDLKEPESLFATEEAFMRVIGEGTD